MFVTYHMTYHGNKLAKVLPRLVSAKIMTACIIIWNANNNIVMGDRSVWSGFHCPNCYTCKSWVRYLKTHNISHGGNLSITITFGDMLLISWIQQNILPLQLINVIDYTHRFHRVGVLAVYALGAGLHCPHCNNHLIDLETGCDVAESHITNHIQCISWKV